MNISILWAVLGFGSLIAAGFTVTKVESTELGTYSSRFVAVILAVLTYYGATSLAHKFPVLVINPVKYRFMKYAIPLLAAAGLVSLGWKIIKNWTAETESVVKSGWKLLLVVVFALSARFFLSL